MTTYKAPEIVAFFEQYQHSIEQPDAFWAEQATQFISWDKPWNHVTTGSLKEGTSTWFDGAKLNACYNCLDRHLPKHENKVAIYWEGNQPNEYREITYGELHQEVCRFANVLKAHRINKGDIVCIYMPMLPEAAVAILACARIGAVHSVVFGGFSAQALQKRLEDTNCKVLITADCSTRGSKKINLKEHADIALEHYKKIHSLIVVKRSLDPNVVMRPQRDYWYHEEIRTQKTTCPLVSISATDPLFILYTSGSTGHPKGIVHAAGGYLTYAATTFKYVFDYKEQDVFFCSADIGWITGHSYFIYGPMCHAATQVMFEGIPTYPTTERYWQIIDKYKVTTFYTAPTAIRSLMRDGDTPLESTSRDSLRILGSVGEPINHEAWEWYYNKVGKQQCPIVDTWWQTETGGIMITPLPGITPQKPGAASWAFFGITPAIVNNNGEIQEGECLGDLVITSTWPGIMHSIYHDKQRMIDTYFSKYPGYYLTGDTAHRDEDGYYWIIGRNDDVINISGHRIGTAEVESAIGETAGVAESAVVDVPHEIKGHGIYAFVTLKKDVAESEQLKQAILNNVTRIIGPFAKPEVIHWTSDLPKTRSGKIMRRILRQIAAGEIDELGDTSTLSNPEIVTELVKQREADQQ
jgi:acetyl-CoA synthetase